MQPHTQPGTVPNARPVQMISNRGGITSLYMLRDRLSSVKGFDEISGTQHMSLEAGAVFDPQGVALDGAGAYMNLPYNTDFNVLLDDNPFTLFFSMKLNTIPSVKGVNEYVIQQGAGDGTERTWGMIHTTDDRMRSHIKSLANAFYGPALIADEWNLFCIRYDGTTVEFIQNGIVGSSFVSALDEAAVGDFIFGANKTFGTTLDGVFDFITTFNRKLDDGELEAVRQFVQGMI